MVHRHRVHAPCRPIGQRPSRAPLHLLGLVVALGASGCLPAPACRRAPLPVAEAAPSSGDGLVPTDSLIWLRVDTNWVYTQCLVTGVTLTDLDAGQVELEEEVRISAPGRILIGWRPVGGLRPGADYEVSWTTSPRQDASQFAIQNGLVAFHTAPEDTPSALPPTPSPDSWWADTQAPTLGLDPWEYTDNLAVWLDGGRFVLMERGAVPGDGIPEDAFRLGARGYIWSSEALPAGETLNVSFASLSLSGQLSGWSEAVSLPLPFPGYADAGDFP